MTASAPQPATTAIVAGESFLLRELLRHEAARLGVRIAADVSNSSELPAALDVPADVVIIEISGEGNWFSQLPLIKAAGMAVVVLTDEVSPEFLVDLLIAGVDGVFRSHASTTEVIRGALDVVNGGAALQGDVAALVLHQWRAQRGAPTPLHMRPRNSLTTREYDVLVALSEGLSTKAIARRLGVALKTVENHKTRVYQKLGARSNAHAISIAIRHGLLRKEQAPMTEPLPKLSSVRP